jgi:DUF3072 family protein
LLIVVLGFPLWMLLVYFNGGQLTGWAIIPCGIFMAGLVWAWMSSRKTPLLDAGTLRERARYPLQIRSASMSNPKTEPSDHTQKNPDEWVSGDDPMTGAQASYLKTLCEQAGTPELFDDNLTKAEASKLIDEMREKANVA